MNIRGTNTIIQINSGIPEAINFLIHFLMVKGIAQKRTFSYFIGNQNLNVVPFPISDSR